MIKNNVFNNCIFSSRWFLLLALAVMVLTVSIPAQAKTAYVSDALDVPMRSGATTGHRIVKFLKSGTAVSVLGASEDDKFLQIELPDGKSGWIATDNVMNIPSARDRIVSVNKRMAKVKQDNKALKKSVAELKSEIRKLKKDKGSLQSERTNLSNSLDDLKITAANPLALSKKNKQLKKERDKAREQASMLDKDNQQLRSNVTQEWFIIGGAVSMGSLIIGLILTRINWRRKRDSWGDSF